MKVNQDNSTYNEHNVYEFDDRILMKTYVRRIIKLLGGIEETQKLSLLDLGIGHGFSANELEHCFKTHTVVDASNELIENYKKTHPDTNVDFELSYFEEFASDIKYDVIIMGFILEHVDNPQFIINKYMEMLKPNGHLYIVVPNAESLHRRFAHKAGILNDMTELSETDIRFGHQRYYTVDTFDETIKAAGYKTNVMEGIWIKPLTTGQLSILNLSEDILRGMCEVAYEYPELSCAIMAEIVNDFIQS